LTGEENYYIDLVSNYIEEHVVAPEMRDFDQTVVYGRDVDMRTVVSYAQRYPMMSPVQLVLVKEAQDIPIKEWELLEAYLEHPQPTTMLVFCYRHKKLDKRTAAYKAIDKTGAVYETPRVYDNQIPGWIASQVQSRGYTIGDKAAMLMAESLGTDLGKIANELGKLYPLLPAGGAITEQLVEQQIGISKDYNVFELQKAIGRRDPVMCNRIVDYFAANPKNNPLPPIVANLYSYFLKVMWYHQLENKSDAPKVLGCPPSFVQDYALAARNYPLGKLASCIGYLYDIDLRSKGVHNSGNVTDGELLKEFIFKTIH
jgi:DNA polymerase-3 subunit delta